MNGDFVLDLAKSEKWSLIILICPFVSYMLPAHFDDVTDDISRLMKANLVRIPQELPKSPTRNIKANYEKIPNT